MTPLVQGYQAVVLQPEGGIQWGGVALVLALAVLALFGSLGLMRRNAALIRDEI